MSFESYIANITSHINKLPNVTRVQFLYFNATDLSKPKVKRCF